MTPEDFRNIGEGSQLLHKKTKKKFNVIAAYSHGVTTVILNRHRQITRNTINKWRHPDGKPVTNISSLEAGNSVVSTSTGSTFIITNATDNHAHAMCTLVVRDSEAKSWQLHAVAWLKPAPNVD